jgi:Protein of unknown function DUF262/HNH endonuclease
VDNAPPTTQRISEIYKWHKEQRLELHPPFQRKPVWTRRNQSYLIDTILNGLPVPEIYIQVKTDAQGNTKYIVVDGQQRINAILQFIEGEYELDDEESEKFANKNFAALSDGNKGEFWDYPIVTRELKIPSEEEVRGVFKRLNKYVARLTPQELRNATYMGHFIKLMNELSDDSFWAENRIVTATEIKRMGDAEFISELFVGMLVGVQNKKETLDNYYSIYDQRFQDKEEKKREFLNIQNTLSQIIGDFRPLNWRNKTDFYSLFLAIAELSREYFIPAEKYQDIKGRLLDFDRKVVLDGTKSKEALVKHYAEAAEKASSDLSNRKKRHAIVRELIIPYLIAKDHKRDFTDEERQIAWNLSKDKKCAICKKIVNYSDYELDHIDPHSKGGRTLLENSQITHKACNASKGNR